MVRIRAAALAVTLALSSGARAEEITFEETTEPYPGVTLLERHTSGPSRRIWVATTSLCSSGVHVDARSSQASRITAGAWGDAMGAQLAVNGDFYRTDRSTPTVYGDAVGVGERWPSARTGLDGAFAGDWYYQRHGWIAFGDGWVELSHTERVKKNAAALGVVLGVSPGEITTAIPAGTRALVSGFPELVVEGAVQSSFPDRSDCADRHPRTAMGLTADRQSFILAVVDGRSSTSVGMTCAELAPLMAEMGAHVAFNLDGGGSTQMWVRGQGTINASSDGSPRPVANHWGVFAGSGHGRGEAPGSCFAPGGCYPAALPEAATSRFADLPDDADGQAAAARVVDAGRLEPCASDGREMFCPACALTRGDAATLVASPVAGDAEAPITATDFIAALAAARETTPEALASECGVSAEGETVQRSRAAALAVAALDLDGDGACGSPDGAGGDDGDGDGDAGDDEPGASLAGGCQTTRGGGSDAGAVLLALALALAFSGRRRRAAPFD